MKQNTFPEAVAYYFKEWKEFNMTTHQHQAMEIMYVINGKCQVKVEGKEVEMRKGQYIFINSNVPHRLMVAKHTPCRMLNLEFEWNTEVPHLTTIEKLMQADENILEMLAADQPYFLLKDLDYVYYTLRNLVIELDHQSDQNALMIDNLLIQLLVLVARSRKDQQDQTNHANELYIKKVLTYIHENYDYEMKVEHLAKMTHLHPSYLHRIFKLSMGMTINDYVTNIRVEKAKMLLVKTDIPVTDISSYVGINTSQYFSNLFKKYTGLSPSAYRKHFLEI